VRPECGNAVKTRASAAFCYHRHESRPGAASIIVPRESDFSEATSTSADSKGRRISET
jgi:hypothetical protein